MPGIFEAPVMLFLDVGATEQCEDLSGVLSGEVHGIPLEIREDTFCPFSVGRCAGRHKNAEL